MSAQLGLLLVAGSIFTFLFMMRLIRKAAVRIEDSIFWILFSFLLIILSAFPGIAFFLSDVLKVQSPINLVYLVIIFVLIVNQFYMTLKISRMMIRQKELIQQIALNNYINNKNHSENSNLGGRDE